MNAIHPVDLVRGDPRNSRARPRKSAMGPRPSSVLAHVSPRGPAASDLAKILLSLPSHVYHIYVTINQFIQPKFLTSILNCHLCSLLYTASGTFVVVIGTVASANGMVTQIGTWGIYL